MTEHKIDKIVNNFLGGYDKMTPKGKRGLYEFMVLKWIDTLTNEEIDILNEKGEHLVFKGEDQNDGECWKLSPIK